VNKLWSGVATGSRARSNRSARAWGPSLIERLRSLLFRKATTITNLVLYFIPTNMSFNFMTKMKIAKVGLRSRRGKLLTYRKRHIVLVLGVAGFFVVLTSQLRLIFTSSAQYYGDRRSLSLTSSLIHLANEQNSTSITTTTITRDDILLSVRPPKPVTIVPSLSSR
jgi:hypothetical protein